ncbi:helix-turn-helix transcriptional regulator [Micromonospora sp. NPDC005172]|uniref:helix-turn-helix domain-containing protein n=1 Tax=Micromonospora sp. NPDC005172 TaxID=3156867 RepID=UPI0033B7316D
MSRQLTQHDEPVGRRVARWRLHRRMTQQMLADRLGKSKSWVDKVERGVRRLDRYPVVRDIAAVLRIDPAVLLDSHASASVSTGLDGVDGVRAALARYHRRPTRTLSADEARQRLTHAWLAYQHAHYTRLLQALPVLLDATHTTTELLTPAYRITASVLVKLGEADLAWLAADRAVTAAGGDPVHVGAATISVTQALRALGRDRLALTAAVTAAATAADHSVRGTLLLQAAMAAAGFGDRRRALDLLDHAGALTNRRIDRADPHRTAFGPAAVLLARSRTALHLGDAGEAIHHHENAMRHDDWPALTAEHRAAHLVDAACAYFRADHPTAAVRALTHAHTVAPDEIRCRPAARTLITDIAQSGPAVAGMARLTTLIGLTR